MSLAHGSVQYEPSQMVGDRYPVDTQAIFSCNGGYNREGFERTTCQTSGNWAHDKPTCKKGEGEEI